MREGRGERGGGRVGLAAKINTAQHDQKHRQQLMHSQNNQTNTEPQRTWTGAMTTRSDGGKHALLAARRIVNVFAAAASRPAFAPH